MAFDWNKALDALGGLGSAALGYLTSREEQKAARDIAKIQASAGGGLNLDTMVTLLQLGQGMSRPSAATARPVVPQYAVPQQLLPSLGASSAIMPITNGNGGQMAYQTAPYVRPALGLGDLVSPILPEVPSLLQGLLPSTGGAADGQFFVQSPSTGVRRRHLVEVSHPVTGQKSWYRNVGRPILFSGDLRVCKRVQKVASRARRASPRKTTTRRKR